jgi:hypothetical protein
MDPQVILDQPVHMVLKAPPDLEVD